MATSAAADKTAADKALADLQTKSEARDLDLAHTRATLEKWEAAYKQAADLARAKEAERAKAAEKAVVLERGQHAAPVHDTIQGPGSSAGERVGCDVFEVDVADERPGKLEALWPDVVITAVVRIIPRSQRALTGS